MKKFSKVLLVSATSAAVSYAAASNAAAVAEVEVNDTVLMAQNLGFNTNHTLNGVMGEFGQANHSDVDFYTFDANAGDVITLDIDNGYGGAGNIDTIIAIFDASGMLLRMNDNTASIDPGSISVGDARIDAFNVPASGTYTVGVSTWPRYFTFDGNVLDPTAGGRIKWVNAVGDYSLNISGISLAVTQVSIEIKPGNKELTPLNPSAKGKIPVAIYGAADFDVSTINQASLTFGSSGNEQSLAKCQKVSRDINKDGYGDLLCHFKNEAAGFVSGDLEAKLKGQTKAKQAFEGQAVLKVVPTSRK